MNRLPRDLPSEAFAERELFRRIGVRSHVAVPLFSAGRLWGLIGLDALRRPRRWAAGEMRRLRVVGEVMMAAVLRHELEGAARRQRGELLHAARLASLSELTVALTHELNQPLTAIRANAQATRRLVARGAQAEDLDDALGDIVDDATRAANLIRRLDTLLRRRELERSLVDVNQVVRDFHVIARIEAERHGDETCASAGVRPSAGERRPRAASAGAPESFPLGATAPPRTKVPQRSFRVHGRLWLCTPDREVDCCGGHAMTEEERRLEAARDPSSPWKKWGPYLSERQWGTVREDYSDTGNAWDYFSHDQARSRAYRWGEDGLAGISDDRQILCFALALWNGQDPILKERIFGLTNSEGNHGEDAKEYYFYLDSTPTHSYMTYLYKYPQTAYPYDRIVTTNRRRGRHELEYELLDTGVFDENRYFDVFVEYAKAAPEDILVSVTAVNRGPESATLHVLPTLWFRNTWSWGGEAPKLGLRRLEGRPGISVVAASHAELGERYLYCDDGPGLLFTENDTNTERIFNKPNASPWVKDAINNYLVHGRKDAVNPAQIGTKAAAHYRITVEAGTSAEIRLRLAPADLAALAPGPFGRDFETVFRTRQQEADDFYASITPPSVGADEALVMRQALAGMLWTKQFYYYDVAAWLKEHGLDPYSSRSAWLRNAKWSHMVNADVISMPDKWEYPWYAAWDLAFHTIPLNLVDPDFAKNQLLLMLDQQYLHPSGQIPAYEWNFADVNPPVHAWASWFLYNFEKGANGGQGDLEFLKTIFQKLLVNFTWWVNRKDPSGANVFEGGFLGLDNIGVFDRSAPLPTGGHLEQADGTTWMAFYCQTMLQIALELSLHEPVHQEMAAKFYEHFLWIAAAMDRIGPHRDELWDEKDGFFYDVLRLPGDRAVRLKVRSMVGLMAICASTIFPPEVERLSLFMQRARDFTRRHPSLVATIVSPGRTGHGGRRLLALLNDDKLRRILRYMLDESEFLSPFGIRALSRYHRDHPYTFSVGRDVYRVDYEPAESTSGLFGGNSNWRGPIWFPVNVLLIRGLLNLYAFYGNDFTVECPTGSGRSMNLFEVAREIAARLTRPFLRDEQGARPVHGGAGKFQSDPHWRDLILFYEYFHGDNGAGLGASHQTGWTGLVAGLIHLFGLMEPGQVLDEGMSAAFRRRAPQRS
jgi:His Kinase A (phospho-acceptor) domain/GAF domain